YPLCPAVGSANRDDVIDEVDVDVEDVVRVGQRRRVQTAHGHVERHVRPLWLSGRERKPQLPEDLQVHVQRLLRVAPRLVGQFGPGLAHWAWRTSATSS